LRRLRGRRLRGGHREQRDEQSQGPNRPEHAH
jgi:hypothetical protein